MLAPCMTTTPVPRNLAERQIPAPQVDGAGPNGLRGG